MTAGFRSRLRVGRKDLQIAFSRVQNSPSQANYSLPLTISKLRPHESRQAAFSSGIVPHAALGVTFRQTIRLTQSLTFGN
jgi:hypothetical protein